MSEQSNFQIAQVNDQLRSKLTPTICAAIALQGGMSDQEVLSEASAILMNVPNDKKQFKVHITVGVVACGKLSEVFKSVREFNTFKEGNDPYGEHDFGSFLADGEKFFWKFDYYDTNFEFFEEDGNRVLTIMLADEY